MRCWVSLGFVCLPASRKCEDFCGERVIVLFRSTQPTCEYAPIRPSTSGAPTFSQKRRSIQS